jgi:hypothetical protein
MKVVGILTSLPLPRQGGSFFFLESQITFYFTSSLNTKHICLLLQALQLDLERYYLSFEGFQCVWFGLLGKAKS